MQKELITLTDTASGMEHLIQVSMNFCLSLSVTHTLTITVALTDFVYSLFAHFISTK